MSVMHNNMVQSSRFSSKRCTFKRVVQRFMMLGHLDGIAVRENRNAYRLSVVQFIRGTRKMILFPLALIHCQCILNPCWCNSA